MADQKLSQLTVDTSPTDDDRIPMVNNPGGTPSNRLVSVAVLRGTLAVSLGWHDITQPPYNLSTSNSSSTIRAGIQSAIDAVEAAGWGTVFIPPGTWQLNSQLTVDSNVTIKGTGTTSVLRLDSSIASPTCILRIGSGTSSSYGNIRIGELALDGNRYGNSAWTVPSGANASGIMWTTSGAMQNVVLENLWIYRCHHYGIGMQGQGRRDNIHLRKIWIEDTGGDGIDIKGSFYGTTNCSMDGIGIRLFGMLATGQAGIDLRNTWNITNVWIGDSVKNFATLGAHACIRFRNSFRDGDNWRWGANECNLSNISLGASGGTTEHMLFVGDVQGTDGNFAHDNHVDGDYFETEAVLNTIAHPRRCKPTWIAAGYDEADRAIYQTTTHLGGANRAPTMGKVQLLLVVHEKNGGGVSLPVVTGCNMTWLRHSTKTRSATDFSISAFYALNLNGATDNSPTDGQLTITFRDAGNTTNETQQRCAYIWMELEDGSLVQSNGSDAIVQANHSTLSATTTAATSLAAFDMVQNSTLFVVALTSTGSVAVARDADWGPLVHITSVSGRTVALFWRDDNDTSPSATLGGTSSGLCVGYELRTARSVL